MSSEVITGLDSPIYHGTTFFQAGPWNQPLHCQNNMCHVHYSHGVINLKYPPYHSTTYPYPQFLGSYVPGVPGFTSPFHAHSRNNIYSFIEKAIDGEYSAISCYQHLINLAPSKEIKERITEIRNDEMRHFRTFSNLYTQLTGKNHQPKMIENCPNQFNAGIDFAFKDEQETVDFYLETASKTDNLKIKEAFIRAAHDEQNHAVWFLYFLNKRVS